MVQNYEKYKLYELISCRCDNIKTSSRVPILFANTSKRTCRSLSLSLRGKSKGEKIEICRMCVGM